MSTLYKHYQVLTPDTERIIKGVLVNNPNPDIDYVQNSDEDIFIMVGCAVVMQVWQSGLTVEDVETYYGYMIDAIRDVIDHTPPTPKQSSGNTQIAVIHWELNRAPSVKINGVDLFILEDREWRWNRSVPYSIRVSAATSIYTGGTIRRPYISGLLRISVDDLPIDAIIEPAPFTIDFD